MQIEEALEKIRRIATAMLTKRLSRDFYFHHLAHTQQVVQVSMEIGSSLHFSAEEQAIVIAAAWLHDIGYCRGYDDHLSESIHIATKVLKRLKVPDAQVHEVIDLIAATEEPQEPITLMQRVLCDSDLHFLSTEAYGRLEMALRKEFEVHLNVVYTNSEWNRLNYVTLSNHRYFTSYAQRMFEPGKQVNLKNVQSSLYAAQDHQ